jgi:hypothetical protein
VPSNHSQWSPDCAKLGKSLSSETEGKKSLEKLQRMLVFPVLLCLWGFGHTVAWAQEAAAHPVPDQSRSELIIQNESQLPDTSPHADYEVLFRAQGGAPPLHWRVEKGDLPPGMKLDDHGQLHGQPEHAGEFRFTIAVRDSSQPQEGVQKEFVLRVLAALNLRWKEEAHVNGNRIEGSAEVSNTTRDDIDLTFIVLAVPANGRAVAIGYQHFPLKRGTVDMELPFGETLPRGGYVVHVDAIGEVPSRNVIHRERMQTPAALQVNVGP